MPLEPRIMFDAAAAATLDAVEPPQPDAPADAGHAGAAPAAGRELVFISSGVPDWQRLAADMRPGVEVFILDAGSDAYPP
jgi:hypothetical protein